MANRINLNQTSFHGAGAIKEIAAEVKVRGQLTLLLYIFFICDAKYFYFLVIRISFLYVFILTTFFLL